MTAKFNLDTMLGGSSAVAADTQVKQIPCNMLIPYHNHKFELYTGERLEDMVQSIKDNGVLIPIIVQPTDNGMYEILIGHNRWNASKLAGKENVPAIIKTELSEDEAEMYVIESNLMQRGFDNLKISEQAAVIAMRHSQMFSQGKRNDIIHELQLLENPEQETSSPMGMGTTSEKLGAEYGMSKNSIARLLRIDKLMDALKPLVDDGTIPLRAAVNISYLDEYVQHMLIKFAKIYKLDIKKSEQLREHAKLKELDQLTVIKILKGWMNNKPTLPKSKTIKINRDTYSKFFNEDIKSEKVTETIEKALEMYFKAKKQLLINGEASGGKKMGIVNLEVNKTHELDVGVVLKNIQDEDTIVEAGTIVYNLSYEIIACEGYIKLYDFETNELALIKMSEQEFEHIETYINFDPILTYEFQKVLKGIVILHYLRYFIFIILFMISLFLALNKSVLSFIGFMLLGWFVLVCAFSVGSKVDKNEILIRSKMIRKRIIKLKK